MFTIVLLPPTVNRSGFYYVSLFGGGPGQQYVIQYKDGLSEAAGTLDNAGNGLAAVSVESDLLLGDWVVQAGTDTAGNFDEAALVVTDITQPPKGQMMISSIAFPDHTKDSQGGILSWQVTVTNIGAIAADCAVTIQIGASVRTKAATGILPGTSRTLSDTMIQTTGTHIISCKTTTETNPVPIMTLNVPVVNGATAGALNGSYSRTFSFAIPPVGTANYPPGYHVPLPGETPLPPTPISQVNTNQEILQALVDSGYWAQLSDIQRAQLLQDPIAWLSNHPYLNTAYPTYFNILPAGPAAGPVTVNVQQTPEPDWYDIFQFGGAARALGLPDFPKEAMERLWNEKIIGPFMQIFQSLGQSLGATGPVNPATAMEKALEVAGGNMALGFGIYLTATLTDLLQPFKGTGLVPMAIDIVNKLGTGLITDGIVGSYTAAHISTPLRHQFQKDARPWLPRGAMADQMRFEANISAEQWRQYKEYEGLSDPLIDAYEKTMYVEPSDRMLISMLEDPVVPKEWIAKTLMERGYNDESIEVIYNWGLRKAAERTRLTSQAVVIDRFKKGYVTIQGFVDELASIGFRADQIGKILLQAQLQRDTDYRDEMRAIAKIAYQKGEISGPELLSNFAEIIEDDAELQRAYQLELLRKLPTPRKPVALSPEREQQLAEAQAAKEAISAAKEQAKEELAAELTAARQTLREETTISKLTADFYVIEFRTGQISEVELKNGLSSVIDNPDIVSRMVSIEVARKAGSA